MKKKYQTSKSQQFEETVVRKYEGLDGEATYASLRRTPDLFLPKACKYLNQPSCLKIHSKPACILCQRRFTDAISI